MQHILYVSASTEEVLGIFVGVQTKVIILGNTSAAESRGRTTGGRPQGQAFFRCFELTFTDD